MRSQRGFTILELLTTVSLSSILMGLAVVRLRDFHNASRSSIFQLASLLKEARSKAVSTTSAVRVVATSDNSFSAAISTSCDNPFPGADWSADTSLSLRLDSGARVESVSIDGGGLNFGSATVSTWTGVCYSSRGFSSTNALISVADSNDTFRVETLLGGAIDIK